MVLLAVLTLSILAVGDDTDTAATTTSSPASSTTTPGTGRAPDTVVARQVLPATLGPGWADVSRENEPVPAEADAGDPCSATAQPIQRGLVVRAALDHLGPGAVVERASLVGGVVEEGTQVPRLDDPGVGDCLERGLAPQVVEENDLVAVEVDPGPTPDGAELSAARFEVRDPEGVPGARFDLLLLRRDRAVSFLLVAVLDPASATPLEDLVAALDAPLEVAAGRLN